jgi:tetratricopeptide (TPR) repeat protein
MSLYSEDVFKINLSRDLSLAKTLNKVGTVAGTMGKTQKAIKNFKAAIIIDPGYATAKKNLNIALKEAEKSK